MMTDLMPAGKYWVGDLCYVMKKEWDEVCGLFFKDRDDHGCNEGLFTLKDGRKFVSFNTKWGDGCYTDLAENEYGVDAGLIGCILVSDIKHDNDFHNLDGGHVHEFNISFFCSGGRSDLGRDWDGVIKIGHIEINTD
jgi:hypothetical protein